MTFPHLAAAYQAAISGVFYREAERIGGKGLERVYYIVFKQGGKVFEEKVGRQFSDNMTPAKAARIRAERIEGRRQSRKEIREAAKVVKWTIDRLWQEYNAGWRTDGGRYENHLKAAFGGKEPHNISPLDIHRLRITLSKTLKPQTVKHVLYQVAVKEVIISGTGVSPVQARAKARGYRKNYPFERNLV